MSYIFISYSHKDKEYVHKLNQHLFEHGLNAWIDDRIDFGSRWPDEVEKRVRECGVFILVMSPNSKQSDWVQNELYLAKQLNKTIYTFLLEGENWWHLHGIQYVDVKNGEMPSAKFIASLAKTAPDVKNISIHIEGNMQGNIVVGDENKIQSEPVGRDSIPTTKINEEASHAQSVTYEDDGLDLFRFIEIPKDKEVPYTFYIGKYPVTNSQYERFLNAPDFANPVYWVEFPKFDEACERIGDWGQEGSIWLRKKLEESNWSHAELERLREGLVELREGWEKSKSRVLLPRYWDNERFGKTNPDNPVVGISWYEANAYCEWLFQNWYSFSESTANAFLKPQAIRLPLETEWSKAAGGIIPEGRYAWDEIGKETTSLRDILRRANVEESGIGKTAPVDTYPLGKSPYGVMDMSGNVWEWQANSFIDKNQYLVLRGGSWNGNVRDARVSSRHGNKPGYPDLMNLGDYYIGFRVMTLSLPNGS